MGYGAHAKRVPARGGSVLTDVNIYKIGFIGKTERGFTNVQHTDIYSFKDYETKCGLYGDGTYYLPYVVESFFKELNSQNNPVEVKVLGHTPSDAVQATYSMVDQDATPSPLWTVKAGRKNVADKSAFGNKIAVKVTADLTRQTMKLTTDTSATPTTALLDSVDGLVVGNYVQFYNGTATEVAKILTINPITRAITFAALVATFTAVLTTVSRVDIDLRVAVKNPKGEYEEKERWIGTHVLSSTIGIAGMVNDPVSGSDYIIMTHNASNDTTDMTKIVPAVLSSWTALTSGADGTISNIAATYNTLLSTYMVDTDMTFLIAPELTSTDHHANMAAWTTDGYKCMYYAHAANEAAEAALKTFGGTLRKGITFAMMPSDKWVEITNPVDDNKKQIPKTGIDAAFWFNTYAKFGESKVASGNKSEMVLNCPDRLVDTNAIVHDDYLGVGDRLIRNYSVNICRYRLGVGITNNSARTFSTDLGYKYQNQIMQFLLYKKSIINYLQSIEQDKGGVTSQNAHYRAVWKYMNNKFKAGHLAVVQKEDGTYSDFNDVCIIVNDFSINTLADLANGIEQLFLQFVAPPPIEEPILQLASAGVTSISG